MKRNTSTTEKKLSFGMKKPFPLSVFSVTSVAICFLLFFCSVAFASDDSGTFRGKWWNYYDRALSSAETGSADEAIKDLKKAVSMRAKDQRMARTYGMHFMDYFPHRELGIIYLHQEKTDDAIRELEESLRGEESAKAVHFLNRARKTFLLKEKHRPIDPPAITIESPAVGPVGGLMVKVRGNASGEGFVSKIMINEVPFRFEMARANIGFESEVQVEDGENRIRITAEDLLGNKSEKTIDVTVDREGPAINIFDIVTEQKSGKKFARIIGDVSDASGISRVLIMREDRRQNSESEIQKNDDGTSPRSYPIDISLELDSKRGLSPFTDDSRRMGTVPDSGKITILASDVLGNETKADIDIDRDLAAFGGKTGPVMLALNGMQLAGMFSFDKEPPVITLKDSGEVPEVFVDRYYVEGEAFDNKQVGRIVLNGRDIQAKKGKKVFFSKIVRLNEGKNRIAVDVYDSADNRASAAFSVTRHVPAVMQTGSRMSVSILPFEVRQKGSDVANMAYEQLIGSFVEQKRFSVIERTKLEQVMLEQKLTKAKLTDPAHSIRLGKLMSADGILATSLKEDAKSIEVVSRVIDTETSEVMEVRDVFSEDKSPAAVKDMMDGLALKIARSFPVAEGIVIKHDGKTVYTDVGDSVRVKKNMGVIIYRKGKEIRHPLTGKSLGWDTVRLGEGHIEEFQQGFSKVRLSDKFRGGDINVRDLVVTK